MSELPRLPVRGRSGFSAIADTLAALAVCAWVGGHAALGAFAARIVFAEAPRPIAAQAMSRVFHEFDGVIDAAVAVLLVAGVIRLFTIGLRRRVDWVAAIAAALLIVLGLFEVSWVHPQIEQLFHAGRTLDPEFASLHRLSERCGHLEVMLAATLLGAHAWSRAYSYT
jgi:uncharacterized membrane protein